MAYFNYNVLPSTRSEALTEILNLDGNGHIGCVYQPYDNTSVKIKSQFLKCTACAGYYNNFCNTMDVIGSGKKWKCKFCNAYNLWEEVMETQNNIYQVQSKCKTILAKKVATIFMIDTTIGVQELEALKKVIKRMVNELSHSRFAVFTLDGSGNVTIHSRRSARQDLIFSADHYKVKSALKSLQSGYFIKHIENVTNDVWFGDKDTIDVVFDHLKVSDNKTKKRPSRATGLALFLGSILSSISSSAYYSHIIAFLAGPCTKASGKIVSRDIKDHIRQQRDINTGNAKHYNQACKFYASIAQKFKVTIELFASCLDEIGAVEMAPLLNFSNVIQQYDSYLDSKFEDTISAYIELRNFHAVYDTHIKVICSNTLLIDGKIANLEREPPDIIGPSCKGYHSDTPKGVSTTNYWASKVSCILNPSEYSVPFLFTPMTKGKATAAEAKIPEHIFIQFQFRFKRGNETLIQISTYCLPTTNHPETGAGEISKAFDVRSEVAYIMKVLGHRILSSCDKSERKNKLILDTLERLASKHYKVSGNQDLLKYLYLLRKSPILSLRNISPDERIFYLNNVLNAGVQMCSLLCYPKVIQFKDDSISSLELTEELLNDPRPLFVDGGHFLGVRYGVNQPELVSKIRSYAISQYHLVSRFPKPQFIDTKIGASQDRYLKSKLVPLQHISSQVLTTQDISFQGFLSILAKLASH